MSKEDLLRADTTGCCKSCGESFYYYFRPSRGFRKMCINCSRHINLGKKFSLEHRMGISESNKGKSGWNKGMKNPKGSNAFLGKKHTLETKLKMSESARIRQDNGLRNIEKLKYQIRRTFLYRQWRSDVYQRDEYTCRDCGIKNGLGKTIFFHAHHSISFSAILRKNNIITIEQAMICDELWNINNGITLCVFCHLNRHRGKNHGI